MDVYYNAETKTASKKRSSRVVDDFHIIQHPDTINFNGRFGTITAIKKRERYPRYEQLARITSVINYLNNRE